MAEIGDVIAGRYVLTNRLGGGGMGEVFAARDETLGRDVAIKIISQSSSGDADSRERLIREARAVARIDHPAIVQVFDVGETSDGLVYLVMERVRGETLRAKMRREGLPIDLTARVVVELADLLDAAHRAGLVHRDVKPDNIMLRSDGHVALLDFGIVKSFRPGGLARAPSTASSAQLTVEGAVVGTPAYLSPEQANGEEVGPASDQFALAVTAFELLTGRTPWTAANNFALIGKILSEDSPPPSALRRDVPTAVDVVFAKALAKDRGARFETVSAFASALGDALKSPTTTTDTTGAISDTANGHSVPAKAPTKSRAIVAVASAVAALVLGASLMVRVAQRADGGAPVVESARSAVAPPSVRLACPQLTAHVGPDSAGWLGAAAADLACRRFAIAFGARFDRTWSPAELLQLPPLPAKEFPSDPFQANDARDRELTRARLASSYLDGEVVREGQHFTVRLRVVNSSDDSSGNVGVGESGRLSEAVTQAVDDWLSSSEIPLPDLDDEIGSWFGTRRAASLLFADGFHYESRDEAQCAKAKQLAEDLGRNWPPIARTCGFDVGAVQLDESSNAALARTADEYVRENPGERGERVAKLLEGARAHEPSRFGRATLMIMAGTEWMRLSQRDRARADYLESIREHPRFGEWTLMAMMSDNDADAIAAAAWEPANLAFCMQGRLSEELELRYLRRRYVLSNGEPWTTGELAERLLFRGAREELLSLAANYSTATPADARTRDHLFALYARSGGRFRKALDVEREIVMNGDPVNDHPTRELIHLADLLGQSSQIADAWLERFLVRDGARGWNFQTVAIAMCARATERMRARCEARLDGEEREMATDVGTFYQGAKRYARHDLEGAASAWRRLVRENVKWFQELMPMDAFAVGDPDLAEWLDADRQDDKSWNGVGIAAARAAERAVRRGDKTKGRALAERVVAAWAVADSPVPAVAEMRKLLSEPQ